MAFERQPETKHLGLVLPTTFNRQPIRNELGLVLPDSFADYPVLRWGTTGKREDREHHLYWPYQYYANFSLRGMRFRALAINNIGLRHQDHDDFHKWHDGIDAPSREVRSAYMVEANEMPILPYDEYMALTPEDSIREWTNFLERVTLRVMNARLQAEARAVIEAEYQQPEEKVA